MSSLIPVPALSVIDGKPVVTSLQVAEAFEREHKHVLRDIEAILAQVPDSFIKPNFGLIDYEVQAGFGVRRDPAYRLSRDGFMLVAMGYTGRKAIAVKVAYIEAFQQLEAAHQKQQMQNARLRALVFELKPEFGVIVRCRQAGLTRMQTAGALGWGEKRVRLAQRTLTEAGLLPNAAPQLALALED